MSKTSIKKNRVVIGMSGGVDSSVAAWLLKQNGYEVIGLFIKSWEDDNNEQYCSSRQDFLDAASAADLIGIELDYVNCTLEYKERVFSNFLREYSLGRTPNPDILCNSEVKFQALLKHASQKKADYIATGHYARVRVKKERFGQQYELLKGLDEQKDQSYFLYRLTQKQLSCTIFPVGDTLKSTIRTIANDLGLHNANKKDSTGICFIGKRPFKKFLLNYLPKNPGPILTINGKFLGLHEGLAFYTLGQRKELGLGNITYTATVKDKQSYSAWYVVGKNFEKNSLYVVQGTNQRLLFSKTLKAKNIHWIANTIPEFRKYFAKIRYRQVDAACEFSMSDKNYFTLNFLKDQWAVTSGQSVVLYDGETCLGGGVIESNRSENFLISQQ